MSAIDQDTLRHAQIHQDTRRLTQRHYLSAVMQLLCEFFSFCLFFLYALSLSLSYSDFAYIDAFHIIRCKEVDLT